MVQGELLKKKAIYDHQRFLTTRDAKIMNCDEKNWIYFRVKSACSE